MTDLSIYDVKGRLAKWVSSHPEDPISGDIGTILQHAWQLVNLPPVEVTYEGWAPCDHEEGDRDHIRTWARDILNFTEDMPDPEGGYGEVALWELTSGGIPDVTIDQMASDQWVRVITSGVLPDGKKARCSIQADGFNLAFIETYRWWRTHYPAS